LILMLRNLQRCFADVVIVLEIARQHNAILTLTGRPAGP